MTDRLRPLWDFDDLDASEQRFRTRLDAETTDAGRAEVMTQIARVEALRGDFDKCLELLDEAEPLAGDAAHMCAIAVDDRELQEQWTQRGLDEGDPYWAGPLYNNLGVAYSEAGDHARALELFELALEARLRDPDNEQAIEWAREAVEEEKQFLAEA